MARAKSTPRKISSKPSAAPSLAENTADNIWGSWALAFLQKELMDVLKQVDTIQNILIPMHCEALGLTQVGAHLRLASALLNTAMDRLKSSMPESSPAPITKRCSKKSIFYTDKPMPARSLSTAQAADLVQSVKARIGERTDYLVQKHEYTKQGRIWETAPEVKVLPIYFGKQNKNC